MSAAAVTRAPRAWARIGQALVLGCVLLVLSGCAAFSARVTIVPSHQTFDLDLIIAAKSNQNGGEIASLCEQFAKSGAKAEVTKSDENTYCELRTPVPLDDKQPFVRHENKQWTFTMTSASLLEWLGHTFPDMQKQYPDGLKLEEFDDFHLRVDFPEPVREHNGGSHVDGTSVIWDDAKPLFEPDGLKASTGENQVWKTIVGVIGGLGILAALASIVLSWRARRRPATVTRTWPRPYVERWWERNRARAGANPRTSGRDAEAQASSDESERHG